MALEHDQLHRGETSFGGNTSRNTLALLSRPITVSVRRLSLRWNPNRRANSRCRGTHAHTHTRVTHTLVVVFLFFALYSDL